MELMLINKYTNYFWMNLDPVYIIQENPDLPVSTLVHEESA